MIDLTSISKAVARDVNIQAEKAKNSPPPERERDIENVYNVRVANPVNVFQQMSIQDLVNYMDTREGLDIDKFMSYLAPEQAKALVLVNLDVTTDLFKQMFDDMFASITPDEEIDDEAVLREEEEEYLRAVVAEGETEDENTEDEEFLPDSDAEQSNSEGSQSNINAEPFDDDDEELEDEEFVPDTDVEQPVEQSNSNQGIVAQSNDADALIEEEDETFENEENHSEVVKPLSVAQVEPTVEATDEFEVEDSEFDDDEEFVDANSEVIAEMSPRVSEMPSNPQGSIAQSEIEQSESAEVEVEDDFDEDEEFDADTVSSAPQIAEPAVNNQVISPVVISAEPVYEDEEFEEEEEFDEDEEFASDIAQPEPQVTVPELQSQSVTPVAEFEPERFEEEDDEDEEFSSDAGFVANEPVLSGTQNQTSRSDTVVTEFENTYKDSDDSFSDAEVHTSVPVNQLAPDVTTNTATDFEADDFEDFNASQAPSNTESTFEADDFGDFSDSSALSNTGSTFEVDDFEDFDNNQSSFNMGSALESEHTQQPTVAETPVEMAQLREHRSIEPTPKKGKSAEPHSEGTVSSKPVKSKKAIYVDDSELGVQEENKPAEKSSSSSKAQKSPASSSSISRSPKPASEGRESVAGEKYEKGWTLMRYLAENKGNREACHIDVVSRYYDKRLIRIGEEHGKFFIRNGYLRK